MKDFQLLNVAVKKPFDKNGHTKIFMADDSDAEINALRNVCLAFRNLLCTFHVAQVVWSWLWDSNHQIPKEHISQLMLIFQHILYAQTVQEVEESYKDAYSYVGVHLPTCENWNQNLNNCWKKKQL
ncbi:hypothetical protein AVEN_213349-1 [Araneus ventricosus]|uniref:MULE transposase domain-containing protein n=1 Tax=Araneus ventricosus TaxID=182803 RepID=A0A4Y2JD27_ARAVE|nr:hypothetical protein AVEN_213349-1 [Araneus ventricosus]